MMISSYQIKAARAMLDWSQDMLAKESGVSPATIYNLEKGQQSCGSSKKIRIALERKGFEFIGTGGVNRTEDKRAIYEGPDSCQKFYEAMLATATIWGGELLAVYRTSELFARSLGVEDFTRLERLEKLSQQVAIKCLLSNAQNARLAAPCVQFRAIPQHPFDPLAIFVCGDKYAIVTIKGRDFSFFVMTSTEIVNAGVAEFEKHWDAALPFKG